MKNHKKSYALLTLSLSTLALSACGAGHPNAFPSGYTHHKKEYKSPVPTISPLAKTQKRSYMDVAQAEQFRDAVYDLLTRITARAGMPPKPVYILQPDQMTTFYANIDNDLRESMRHLGYAIADEPEGAYVFGYDAYYIDSKDDMYVVGQPNVEVILSVFNGINSEASQLTREAGQYYVEGAEDLNIQPTHYGDLPQAK